MMYKILLVDDEKMVLKSLMASIDWQNYGFTVVATANSSTEALEKIAAHKPDVVFTDIRMPEISGLELLHIIKQQMPGILCVVISGYAEFAYVQKALRLEAVGYCLKPFDYDEITFYLKRIRKNLDAMYGPAQDSWFERLESQTEDTTAYLQAYFQKNGLDFARQDIVAVYVKGLADCESHQGVQANAGFEKRVFLIEKEAVAALAERCPVTAHIGVSQRITDAADVKKAVSQARQHAYQFFCQPDCGRIVWEIPEPDLSQINALQSEIRHGGYEHRLQAVKDAFDNGQYSIDAAVLLYNLMEIWLDGDKTDEEPGFLWEYDALCAEYRNAGEMLDNFRTQICRFNNETEQKNNHQTFAEIYQYVEKHFNTHITISALAEKFHINNCYISHLFKRKTGKTLTEFITEKRISQACQLLRDTDHSIAAIAEQVGFNEYFYFSKVFRKVMNCTPSEYRETM